MIKPPKFGNCTVEDSGRSKNGVGITFEDFKRIFEANETPSPSAVQKLKQQLDSLVEDDDWNDEALMAEEFCCRDSELADIILYSTSGYLCRRLLRLTKCSICRDAILTKLSTSDIEVAELVNLKTKGFLLYCNLYLYRLFHRTERFFAENVKYGNCYERTMNDVFEFLQLNFPCDEHGSEFVATSLHYYVVMRMRQYEREQNRGARKKSQHKKKEAKLCKT